MRTTHRGKAVTVMKEARQAGVHSFLVVALVLDDLARDEVVCFSYERNRTFGRRFVERVGNLPQPVEGQCEGLVVLVKCPQRCGRHRCSSESPRWCQCTQSIEDHGDVDEFLSHRARDRR